MKVDSSQKKRLKKVLTFTGNVVVTTGWNTAERNLLERWSWGKRRMR
jgi:hypothetical protein